MPSCETTLCHHLAGLLIGFALDFCFNRYGRHRDLHSFPTRRASDLPLALHRQLEPTFVPDGFSCTGLRSRPVRTSDRKSTRLNSSHANISYAVFCLKKKTWVASRWRHAQGTLQRF